MIEKIAYWLKNRVFREKETIQITRNETTNDSAFSFPKELQSNPTSESTKPKKWWNLRNAELVIEVLIPMSLI